MYYLSLFITPLIGAVIGYFTNWLAIKMLFRPHREIRVRGMRLPFTPGLIPKERERLTKKIAETVGEHVLTPELLAQELTSSGIWGAGNFSAAADIAKEALNSLLPGVLNSVSAFPEKYPQLDEKLRELTKDIINSNFGKLAALFVDHEKIYAGIKDNLIKYLREEENKLQITQKLNETIDTFLNNADAIKSDEKTKAALRRAFEKLAAYVAEHMQVQDMIERKINAFAVEEAEALILSVVNRELNAITLLGGALGFIIGLVSLLPRLFY